MRERDIEAYLVKRVKALGGEIRKLGWIGRRGAPDRVVFMAHLPGPIWIELKAPGEKPSKLQSREHARLMRMGQRVEVIDSIEQVDAVLADEEYEDPNDYRGMGWVDSRGRP